MRQALFLMEGSGCQVMGAEVEYYHFQIIQKASEGRITKPQTHWQASPWIVTLMIIITRGHLIR